MEAITLVTLVAFVKKIVDLSKFVTNRQLNAIVTQAWTWIAGAITLGLASQADITAGLEIWGTALGDLNFWSIVLGGAMLGSGGSLLYDFQAARDHTDTAKTPPLLPGTPDPTCVPVVRS